MLASARTHVVVSREQLEFLQEAGKRHAPCQHFSYLIKTLDTFETRAKDIDSHQFAHVAAWHDAIELFRRLLALLTEVAQSKQFHTHEKRAFLWFCFNSHRFIPDASLRHAVGITADTDFAQSIGTFRHVGDSTTRLVVPTDNTVSSSSSSSLPWSRTFATTTTATTAAAAATTTTRKPATNTAARGSRRTRGHASPRKGGELEVAMATNGDNGGQGVSVVADDDDTKHNTSKTMLERFNLDSPSAAKEEGSSGARSSSAQLRRQRMIDQLKAEPAFQQRQHQQQHRKLERRSTELMLTESIAYRASLERLRRSVKNAPTVQPLDGHGGGGGGGDGVNGWWPRGGDLASGLQVTWLQPQINAQWDEYFRERQQELLRDGLASREATRTITMDDG